MISEDFVFLLCRLPDLAEATYRDHYPSSCVVGVTKNFCHIFLGNHRGQLPDILHRASVWRTVSCNAFLNLRHIHFLFDATLNIVDIDKFAHKIIFVTFFSGITEASFLIFGTEHQYGELYRRCNAFLNLRHVLFLFDATLNIVDMGKFAHKIIVKEKK